MSWFLILSRRQAGMDAIREQTAAHFEWMKRQHETGRVLFSGPTPDRTMGIYVMRAVSKEEADTVAATDPFHVSGLRKFEIIEWEVHQALGVGPFDLASIEFLARQGKASGFTPLPEE